jgi:hypothetical protein
MVLVLVTIAETNRQLIAREFGVSDRGIQYLSLEHVLLRNEVIRSVFRFDQRRK